MFPFIEAEKSEQHNVAKACQLLEVSPVAAALDQVGRLLGVAELPVTRAGYQQLHAWLASHGEISAVGVEGCGERGLARHLSRPPAGLWRSPTPQGASWPTRRTSWPT